MSRGEKMKRFLQAIVLVGLMASPAFGQSLLPNGQQTFVDANGSPLAGGSVYFYIPGTTTAKFTYQDPGLTVPNTNPIILNAAGRAIVWGVGEYREVVYDQFGTLIWDQLTYGAPQGNTAASSGFHSVVFDESGGLTQTFTVPLSATASTRFKFRMVGGGGQSGGVPAVANAASGGGSSGSYAEVTLYGFAPGDTITVTIGAGGKGASAGANGNDGGDTTLTYQTHVIALARGGSGGKAVAGLGIASGGNSSPGNFFVDLTGTALAVESQTASISQDGMIGIGAASNPYGGNGGSDPIGGGGVWHSPAVSWSTNGGGYGGGAAGLVSVGSAFVGYSGTAGAVIVEYTL